MKNIFITPGTKILDAMKLLATTSSRCLIVTNDKRYFYGTLNDGDLRRGILKGLTGKATIKTHTQTQTPEMLLRHPCLGTMHTNSR